MFPEFWKHIKKFIIRLSKAYTKRRADSKTQLSPKTSRPKRKSAKAIRTTLAPAKQPEISLKITRSPTKKLQNKTQPRPAVHKPVRKAARELSAKDAPNPDTKPPETSGEQKTQEISRSSSGSAKVWTTQTAESVHSTVNYQISTGSKNIEQTNEYSKTPRTTNSRSYRNFIGGSDS